MATGDRQLMWLSTTCPLCDCSYHDKGATTKYLQNLAEVVAGSALTYIGDCEEDAGIANIDRILDELVQKSKLEPPSKELQRANPELAITPMWSATHNIDILRLLAFLKIKLFEEKPIILYNYSGMHKRSVELLRLIRDKEHHRVIQYITPTYMPDDFFISDIVILIYHIVRGSARNAHDMGLAFNGVQPISRIATSAGDVMREYLRVACKKLRVFCKNKTPIQDDAAYDTSELENLVFSWLRLEDVLCPKGVASLQTGIPVGL